MRWLRAARRDRAGGPPRIIAFYLPQFHPIPENDAWWGEGFTEWTNVRRATPWFSGHDQPREPGPLGYYDLRDVGVQLEQARLARAFGVHGFCYHYYWFAGKRLLDRPLDQLRETPELDLPFCLCWANENWTRRWDGHDDEVLIGQRHSPEDDRAFLESIAPFLADPRYITVRGRPLLVVYRPPLLPDARATAARWRAHARVLGLPEPYLVNALSIDPVDPRALGFDAAVEFPPHGYPLVDARRDTAGIDVGFSGHVYDYGACVREAEARLRGDVPWLRFPCAMPGWDNTPRRQGAGSVFTGSSPEAFGRWMEAACRRAARFPEPDERLVFVNAWNEWGEGAYLEPDARTGDARLAALRDAAQRALR